MFGFSSGQVRNNVLTLNMDGIVPNGHTRVVRIHCGTDKIWFHLQYLDRMYQKQSWFSAIIEPISSLNVMLIIVNSSSDDE